MSFRKDEDAIKLKDLNSYLLDVFIQYPGVAYQHQYIDFKGDISTLPLDLRIMLINISSQVQLTFSLLT